MTFPVTLDWPFSDLALAAQMPLIEELPTTNATRISHGWAYVPDTGPAKAILPPGGRKRGTARDGAGNRADGTAKQAKLLQARLADLDKENYKDTTIPIPPRAKEKGSSRVVISHLETSYSRVIRQEDHTQCSTNPDVPADLCTLSGG